MNMNKLNYCVVAFALSLCAVLIGVTHGKQVNSANSNDKASESKRVESYLRSLQLDQLLIEHLEFVSAQEQDPAKRLQIVQRLVGLYAERMMQPIEEDAPNWFEKTDLLLRTYPELATSAIRIAMLQSKYLVNEKRFREWWIKGQPGTTKGAVVGQWRELQDELTSFRRRLDSDYQELAATLQTITENRLSETRRLARMEGVILHCNFLSGWSAYFMGILEPENQKSFMQESDAQFRTFLQIEPNKTLTEVPASWFDFTSEWNSRALVGLAMCQRALDHESQSKYCFDLIESQTVTQRTRDLRFLWQLNSRLYLEQYIDAQEIVEVVSQATNVSPRGRVRFWVAALESAIAIEQQSSNVAQQMGRAGLIGLTREFQAPLIEKYLAENNLKLGSSDFLSLWITGYLEFSKAETAADITLAGELYKSAKEKLERAIEISKTEEVGIVQLDVARCRYLVGRIDFVQRDFARAAPAFQETADLVLTTDPPLAAESQWLAVRSWVELSTQNSRNQFKATQAIDQLIKRFPGSTFAKRAEFERFKIRLAQLDSDQALEKLGQVDEDDFNFPLVLNEISRIKYQRWLAEFRSQTKSAEKLEELLLDLFASEKEYRGLVRASNESKSKTLLLTLDALLRYEEVDRDAVYERINLVKRTIEDARITGSVLQEYHYYVFLFYDRIGNPGAAAEANWLRENAMGTRFEKAALVRLAQQEDERIESGDNLKQSDYVRLKSIYQRLVELYGDTPTSLKESANARVAYARLAELNRSVGDQKNATKMFETLNEVFPKNRKYLREIGVSRTDAKQYESALKIWQRLSTGVDPGSEVWFEAKYWLAYCMNETGETKQALELHKQTIRLSTNLPPAWKDRYDALLDSLSSAE